MALFRQPTDLPSRRLRHSASSLSPGRIALGYAIISILWIAFSDAAVTRLELDPSVMTVKGTVFVFVTAALLYVTVRRLVETVRLTSQALRQSEMHLAEAQGLSHTGSWVLDVVQDRLSWSDEVFRIFGIASGTPLNYDIFLAAVHPDDRAFVDRAWKSALRGATYDVEHRIVVDGEVRWVRERAQLEFDADGRPTNGIGTVQDITQRKRAEETLRERAELLNLTHDSIFVVDLQGVIKYWNSGAEQRYGWSAEQAVGSVVHEMLNTVFPSPLEEIKAEVTRTGRWQGELLHTRKDGSQVVVASRWALQRDGHGAPVAILETNNDITERKRAEEALRRSEAYLATAESLSHTGSFGWHIVTGEIFWSEETFRIFEMDPLATPTLDAVRQRMHPDDRVRVDGILDRISRVAMESASNELTLDRNDSHFEHRLLMADGRVKHLRVSGRAVRDSSGEAEFVGAVTDITAVRKAERELLEARVAERTRIARELHDTLLQSFQALLLRFQAVSYMLPEQSDAKRQLDGAIEHAAGAIVEGRDAVQELRTSTVHSGDLALAVNALGHELAGGSVNRSLEFHVAVSGKGRTLLPAVRDDTFKIAAEALRNAFRHAEPRRIEVEIHYDDQQFRLRVRDDGLGIHPGVLSGQGRAGHYGLRGMRERATAMGGTLDVWSEVGAGTIVELGVPAGRAYARTESVEA